MLEDPKQSGVDLSRTDGVESHSSPWSDLDSYIQLPRLGSLLLSPDGKQLVASISHLNHEQTAWVSSLWAVDPQGKDQVRRLTRAVEGESAAAFLPDSSLLFTSSRALPKDSDDNETVRALWCLPAAGGEAFTLARRDGGWRSILTAKKSHRAIFVVPFAQGAVDEAADAKKRANRKTKKVSALLHESTLVRYWDHDLGQEWSRLYAANLPNSAAAGTMKAGDFACVGGDYARSLGSHLSLSDDGTTVLADWTEPDQAGASINSVVKIDVATGQRTKLVSGRTDSQGRHSFTGSIISPDGATALCLHSINSSQQAPKETLYIIDLESGKGRDIAVDWDRYPSPVAFSPDSQTLYCEALQDGTSPIFALDLATETVRQVTHDDFSYTSIQPSPDGKTLYAIRSSYTCPGQIVALDAVTGVARVLDCGLSYPDLPGSLQRVEATATDGARIPGYLAIPTGCDAEHPAPLVLWIHGGPLGSWNAWSWRWCPWLLVSQGYAVLLPDPALSVGYGREFVQRGWGNWGQAPFTDLMAITDAIEQRTDIDASRVAAMGGSFGGYMANWIAGHTDRFACIVSHASLWNLTAFASTTDHASYWSLELTDEMQAANSPHLFSDKITTPMLVVHGDKDYRVPIGEGLALWWALNANWKGQVDQFPHKFLYFPDENHWVLTPQHAKIWYHTVQAFLATHMLNQPFTKHELL